MGRARRLRTNTGRVPVCARSGKPIYADEDKARAELARILSKPGVLDQLWRPANAVPCKACGGWHLTGHAESRPGAITRRRPPAPGRRIPPRSTHDDDPVDRGLDLPDRTPGAAWTSGFHDPGGSSAAAGEGNHLTQRLQLPDLRPKDPS